MNTCNHVEEGQIHLTLFCNFLSNLTNFRNKTCALLDAFKKKKIK